MDIVFNCSNCDQELAVDQSGSGTQIDCPSCGEHITIPSSKDTGGMREQDRVLSPEMALSIATKSIQDALVNGDNNLNLSNLHLLELPELIGKLKNLRTLNLSRNALSHLPEDIYRQDKLRNLGLSHNRFKLLPPSIGSLRTLETLDISFNQLSYLPKSLGNLSEIKHLNIANNRLLVLAGFLGELSKLSRLDVSNNRQKKLPEFSDRVSALKHLDASNNQLIALPNSLKVLTKLNKLDLQGNETLGLPQEVLESAPDHILDYCSRIEMGNRPLNEAKLILVGRGAVGKTCIVKRLLKETFDEQEKETQGIEIQPWEVYVPSGDKVRLHLWDFGGQEILHATHQFFLTERTLYLLVLAGREGRPGEDAEYWLQLIRSFGRDSKVIVILNKTGEHPFDVNRAFLQEKYPFIADFIKTDCKHGVGILELKNLIVQQTDLMEHRMVAFPKDWFAIKERLSAMKEDYITWEEYQQMCREQGESDTKAQRKLAWYLNLLGIALNFYEDPRLKDTHVLNPRWVTEGIYPLLRARTISGREGVLELNDLADTLDSKSYPNDKHLFLIGLM
jgi:internalin A